MLACRWNREHSRRYTIHGLGARRGRCRAVFEEGTDRVRPQAPAPGDSRSGSGARPTARKRWARGSLLEVLEPSPSRRVERAVHRYFDVMRRLLGCMHVRSRGPADGLKRQGVVQDVAGSASARCPREIDCRSIPIGAEERVLAYRGIGSPSTVRRLEGRAESSRGSIDWDDRGRIGSNWTSRSAGSCRSRPCSRGWKSNSAQHWGAGGTTPPLPDPRFEVTLQLVTVDGFDRRCTWHRRTGRTDARGGGPASAILSRCSSWTLIRDLGSRRPWEPGGPLGRHPCLARTRRLEDVWSGLTCEATPSRFRTGRIPAGDSGSWSATSSCPPRPASRGVTPSSTLYAGIGLRVIRWRARWASEGVSRRRPSSLMRSRRWLQPVKNAPDPALQVTSTRPGSKTSLPHGSLSPADASWS